MKKFIITMIILFITLSIFGVIYFRSWITPPSNEEVIRTFNEHRQAFEQIRTMLQEDRNVRQIANWGIRTQGTMIDTMPPIPDLSLARYKKYMALLSSARAISASRSAGDNPDSCIYIWASGWAADTNHLALCWRGRSINRSEEYDAPRTDGRFTFYPITGHWFIQKEI